MEREELEKWDEASLDDLVHDYKSDEASSINNQGREAQIEYILGASKSNTDLEQLVKELGDSQDRLVRSYLDRLKQETERAEQYKKHNEELDRLNGRLIHTMDRIACALKGPPPRHMLHSLHDLPEIADQLKAAASHMTEAVYILCDSGGHFQAVYTDEALANRHALAGGQTLYKEYIITELPQWVIDFENTKDHDAD